MEELSVTEFDREIETLELPELSLLAQDSMVSDAIETFNKNDHGLIGLGSEGKITGVVSEWDLIHQFSPEIDPKDVLLSDLMTENPIILYSENTLYEVMTVMGRRNFSSFPVCDENGNAKYVFNTRILFKFIASYFDKFLGELGTKETWEPTKEIQTFTEDFNYSETMKDDSSLHESYFLTPFDRIPSGKLAKVDEDLPIADAWKAFMENGLEAMVVTEFKTKLIGIITVRDLITKVIAKKEGMDLSLPISTIMTSNPHSLMYKHPIGYGINHFFKYGFRHMVVVDEDRIPLKVVSLLEIFSHLIGKIKLN